MGAVCVQNGQKEFFRFHRFSVSLRYDLSIHSHPNGTGVGEVCARRMSDDDVPSSRHFNEYPPHRSEGAMSIQLRKAVSEDVPFWMAAAGLYDVTGIRFVTELPEGGTYGLGLLASYKNFQHRLSLLVFVRHRRQRHPMTDSIGQPGSRVSS